MGGESGAKRVGCGRRSSQPKTAPELFSPPAPKLSARPAAFVWSQAPPPSAAGNDDVLSCQNRCASLRSRRQRPRAGARSRGPGASTRRTRLPRQSTASVVHRRSKDSEHHHHCDICGVEASLCCGAERQPAAGDDVRRPSRAYVGPAQHASLNRLARTRGEKRAGIRTEGRRTRRAAWLPWQQPHQERAIAPRTSTTRACTRGVRVRTRPGRRGWS